jgi:hypothetical protein
LLQLTMLLVKEATHLGFVAVLDLYERAGGSFRG